MRPPRSPQSVGAVFRKPFSTGLLLATLVSGCFGQSPPPDSDLDFDLLESDLESSGWDITVHTKPAVCDLPPSQPRVTELVRVTSDPAIKDTDGDGVHDGDEFTFHSHPRDNDTDRDGLSDLEESRIGQNASLARGGSLRLWDVDSDADCLADPDELWGYGVPGIGTVRTDPTVADTDRDGWTDGYEAQVSRSDPTNEDTDADGASDRLDVDPLRDVALNLTFQRLLVKSSSRGSEFDAEFHYSTDGPSGTRIQPPMPAPTLHIVVGVNHTVGAVHSPGLRDVEDRTASDEIFVQFFVQRADTRDLVDVSPGDESIVTLRVNPQAHRWTVESLSGPTESSVVLETSEARVEFWIGLAAA